MVSIRIVGLELLSLKIPSKRLLSMSSKLFQDNGGRRLGSERREVVYTQYIPERRSGKERRSGNDRRKTRR
jgi:hypothetical protein